MKIFKIKVTYRNGYATIELQGKNFIDAFTKYYKSEEKQLRFITGYSLVD